MLGVGCDAFQYEVQPLPVGEIKPEPKKVGRTRKIEQDEALDGGTAKRRESGRG
jgi:hypothetical protein